MAPLKWSNKNEIQVKIIIIMNKGNKSLLSILIIYSEKFKMNLNIFYDCWS